MQCNLNRATSGQTGHYSDLVSENGNQLACYITSVEDKKVKEMEAHKT